MADRISARMDFGDMNASLERLAGAGRVSLARRMGVAGGTILRDEAKVNALQSHARTSWTPNPNSRGSETPGTLADAIYLAFDKKGSSDTLHRYAVSWNAKKAWWGKLREFGYFQRFRVYKDAQGVYHTTKEKLPQPKRRPADPFLAPAFDAHLAAVKSAMIAAGKIELPKILRGDIGE